MEDNQFLKSKLLIACNSLYQSIEDCRDENDEIDLMRLGWKVGLAHCITRRVRIISTDEIVQGRLDESINDMRNAVFAARDDEGVVDLLKMGFYLGDAYQSIEDTLPLFELQHEKTTDQLIKEAQLVQPQPLKYLDPDSQNLDNG